MRRRAELAEGTTTMLSYLIVSGLCLLLLLHIVCKVWQNALEVHSAADNLDETRDFAARGQKAANGSERNSSKTGWRPTTMSTRRRRAARRRSHGVSL